MQFYFARGARNGLGRGEPGGGFACPVIADKRLYVRNLGTLRGYKRPNGVYAGGL